MFVHDFRADIRDLRSLEQAISTAKPDVLIHMAAQPLVREGYRDPAGTFQTNVDGTLNVLRASQNTSSVQAQVIVTTDKVYKNKNQRTGYKESDELGGDDPYSASKSMADILTQSWIKSVKCPPTAIARAGNVIGGGDVSADRLIPDLIRAYSNGEVPKLRYPNAVRPWQHVLDCLSGYLKLVDYLIEGGRETTWNFGPNENEFKKVSEVADIVSKLWNMKTAWLADTTENPHEAELLALDSGKARNLLKWRDKYDFETSVIKTSRWYEDVMDGSSAHRITQRAAEEFLNL
jgi:CDP-glucose 4,6-dehydratase